MNEPQPPLRVAPPPKGGEAPAPQKQPLKRQRDAQGVPHYSDAGSYLERCVPLSDRIDLNHITLLRVVRIINHLIYIYAKSMELNYQNS